MSSSIEVFVYTVLQTAQIAGDECDVKSSNHHSPNCIFSALQSVYVWITKITAADCLANVFDVGPAMNQLQGDAILIHIKL